MPAIPVDEALEIVLAHTPRSPAEDVLLDATPSAACWPRTSPPTSTCRPSTARRWTATRCARRTWRTAPVTLEVAGQIRAGQYSDRPLGSGAGGADDDGRAGARRAPTAVQPVEKTRAARRRPPRGDPGAGGDGRPHRAPGLARSARATIVLASGHDRSIRPRWPCWPRWARARARRPPADRRRAGHRRRAGGRVGHARAAAASATATATRCWRRRAGRAPRCVRSASCPTSRTASPTRCARASPPDVLVHLGRRVGGRLRPRRGGAGALRRRPALHQGRDQARRAAGVRPPRATSSSSACPATPCRRR